MEFEFHAIADGSDKIVQLIITSNDGAIWTLAMNDADYDAFLMATLASTDLLPDTDDSDRCANGCVCTPEEKAAAGYENT